MEIHGDMTLVSEDGGRIRAHRVVLPSASTLFRDMFQTHEEKVEYQVITMKGVTFTLMKAMVKQKQNRWNVKSS